MCYNIVYNVLKIKIWKNFCITNLFYIYELISSWCDTCFFGRLRLFKWKRFDEHQLEEIREGETYGECIIIQQSSEFGSKKCKVGKRNRFIGLREKVGIGHKTFRLLAREFKSPVYAGKNSLPKLFGLWGEKTVQCRNIGNLWKFLCSAAC